MKSNDDDDDVHVAARVSFVYQDFQDFWNLFALVSHLVLILLTGE